MLRNIVGHKKTDKSVKTANPAAHVETFARNATHGRHTVMWLSGFKFTLRVDDWMRGH